MNFLTYIFRNSFIPSFSRYEAFNINNNVIAPIVYIYIIYYNTFLTKIDSIQTRATASISLRFTHLPRPTMRRITFSPSFYSHGYPCIGKDIVVCRETMKDLLERGIIFSRRPISIVGRIELEREEGRSDESKSRESSSKLQGTIITDACCRGEETRESVSLTYASGFANSCPVSHHSTSGEEERGKVIYINIRVYRRIGGLEEGSLFFSWLVLPSVEVFRATFVTGNRRKMYASVVLAATSRLASSQSFPPRESRKRLLLTTVSPLKY